MSNREQLMNELRRHENAHKYATEHGLKYVAALTDDRIGQIKAALARIERMNKERQGATR